MEVTGPPAQHLVYRRMPAPRTDASTLAGYAAAYYSDELDTTWGIVVKDGNLTLKRRALPDQTLQPVFLDAFQSPRGVLRFVRGGNGRVSGFVIGTGRVTGFKFEARSSR